MTAELNTGRLNFVHISLEYYIDPWHHEYSVSITSVTRAPTTISNENYRECWHKWPFILLNQSMSSTRVYPTFSLFNDKYKNIFRLFKCWPCVLPQTHACNHGEFEYIKTAAQWRTCCVYVASWVEKIKFLVGGELLTTFVNRDRWSKNQTRLILSWCVTNERYCLKVILQNYEFGRSNLPRITSKRGMLTSVWGRGALFHCL